MSYSSISDHRSMVLDGHRNAAYMRALEKVVASGCKVMDLGAGLGVHGLNAAYLGAEKVYLVEPAPVIEAARLVASANNLLNVECHPCRVEELQLDEQVDVIVSVFTGNFLLTEDLLPSLFYARDHFLAPGGKMIPDRARMEVVPVTAADYYLEHIEAWSAYPEHAAASNLPALDYQAVQSFAANTMYYDDADSFQALALAAPAPLMELDFTVASSTDCDSQIKVEISEDGVCHGWLGWFQAHLVDEWLSTGLEESPTHWRQVFMPLEQPLRVEAGERLGFSLKRPEHGEWTWTTEQAGQRQRLSTFLSQPLTPDRIRRSSDSYQPDLSPRGEAARWLLPLMVGDVAVSQLADEVAVRFPGLFASYPQALKFVKDLAERYS